jgi:cytochrome c peroxidase
MFRIHLSKPGLAGLALAGVLAGALATGLLTLGRSQPPGPSDGATGTGSPPAAALSLSAQLGSKLFFDPALSASGRMACASCHDPQQAYGPPNALAVQLGGADLDRPGIRAVPSLRYKRVTPAYSHTMFDPEGAAPAPGGGFDWDGRADTLAAQAAGPLLSPFEMANASPDEVVAKVKKAAYAPLFRQAFGAQAFDDSARAFAQITEALQAFQLEDPSFRPYSSKFDRYVMQGKGVLSVAERRGQAVFNDPNRGNCAACHLPDLNQFTDYMYSSIGAPRNPAIPANADRSFFDLGLCGPLRTDLSPTRVAMAKEHCGQFKTPTLRNAAIRPVFFHNGVLTSLEQVVRFYNTRDTHPEIWYPTVGGTPRATPSADFPGYGLITTQYRGGVVRVFNDLPKAYAGNVDTSMPLDRRAPGAAPPMSEQEVGDLICFLKTLTDDFVPPAKEPATGPCVH